MLQALIFDVDGTLADTEMAHLAAFNHAFSQFGLDWHWDVPLYTQLLEVSGGKERIEAYWKTRSDMPTAIDGSGLQDTIAQLHAIKTAAYEKSVQEGKVQLRPGVLMLIHEAIDQGLTLAIATTTSPVNISALLHQCIGAHWREHFAVVEDASSAPRKKPDPMVYEQTLQRLGLCARQCMAIEDSANGLQAARRAGLPTVITHNPFTHHHDFTDALRVLPSLQGVGLAQLREWHAHV